MAGALFLPVELPSAGINSLKSNQNETSNRFQRRNFGPQLSGLSEISEKIRLHNFDNSNLRKPKGQVNLKISVGREWVTANFQVVSNSCQSVLGAPELRNL